MKDLIEKIVRIQSTLKAPKNQHNNFGNYNYRSCEDILEAVKPLLAKEGLILTISDDMVVLGDRFYVKATATITDGVNSVSNSAFAREEESKKGMDSSQLTGSTSSYARKYALNGLLCIDDTKDADTTNTHGKNDELVKKKVVECKKSIEAHGKYVEGDGDYGLVTRFANKIFELGYKDDANEILALLKAKTEKDSIPY